MSRPSRDFTESSSPFSAVIVPRTRTLVCAYTVAVASASSRTAMVRMVSSLWVRGEHHYSAPHSMLNPFQPLKKVEVQRYTALPAKLRKKRRSAWSIPNRQGAALDSFLEGPSFDRQGNLWCVDIPNGRIFRVSAKGEWDLAVQYDGWPNGLKFHKDGRAFIADYKQGLLALDPQTARLEPILETAYSEGFKGLNDLHFAANGDLYFTDQGQTGIADPTGRVYRLRANGALDRLC